MNDHFDSYLYKKSHPTALQVSDGHYFPFNFFGPSSSPPQTLLLFRSPVRTSLLLTFIRFCWPFTMTEYNIGNIDVQRLGFTSADKAEYRRAQKQVAAGAPHHDVVTPLRSDASKASVRKVINPTTSSRKLMRQVSGLGMEDPIFGTKESGPMHPSNIFDDMSIGDIAEDMRDMVSIASDPTATGEDGLDVNMFQASLLHLNNSLSEFSASEFSMPPQAVPVSPALPLSSSPGENKGKPTVAVALSTRPSISNSNSSSNSKERRSSSSSSCKEKRIKSHRKTAGQPPKSPGNKRREVKLPTNVMCLDEVVGAPPVAKAAPNSSSKKCMSPRDKAPATVVAPGGMHDSLSSIVDNILMGATTTLKKQGAVSKELYHAALSQSMPDINVNDLLGLVAANPRRRSVHHAPDGIRRVEKVTRRPEQVRELMTQPKSGTHRVLPFLTDDLLGESTAKARVRSTVGNIREEKVTRRPVQVRELMAQPKNETHRTLPSMVSLFPPEQETVPIPVKSSTSTSRRTPMSSSSRTKHVSSSSSRRSAAPTEGKSTTSSRTSRTSRRTRTSVSKESPQGKVSIAV